jgi:hypothetical protein
MRIIRVFFRDGNSFEAALQCEFCGERGITKGTNEEDYRKNVLPKLKCRVCKKSTK